MFNQMKQLNEMKKKAQELQRQLEAIKVEKTNSSRTLAVTVNGAQHVEKFRIEPNWFSPDKKEALENALAQLVNDAFQEAQKQTASQAATLMKDLKGMNLPGF